MRKLRERKQETNQYIILIKKETNLKAVENKRHVLAEYIKTKKDKIILTI